MCPVKVGRAISFAKVERVVAVVEETQRALFIGSVRVGIRKAEAEAVAHALFHVRLQRIVTRDAGGFVAFGFGGVADVRHPKAIVAAFVRGEVVAG